MARLGAARRAGRYRSLAATARVLVKAALSDAHDALTAPDTGSYPRLLAANGRRLRLQLEPALLVQVDRMAGHRPGGRAEVLAGLIRRGLDLRAAGSAANSRSPDI